jgi:hypothetical protein
MCKIYEEIRNWSWNKGFLRWNNKIRTLNRLNLAIYEELYNKWKWFFAFGR